MTSSLTILVILFFFIFPSSFRGANKYFKPSSHVLTSTRRWDRCSNALTTKSFLHNVLSSTNGQRTAATIIKRKNKKKTHTRKYQQLVRECRKERANASTTINFYMTIGELVRESVSVITHTHIMVSTATTTTTTTVIGEIKKKQ